MKETNLDAIKSTARTLLYVDITETEFPFCLIHPFLNNRYMSFNNKDRQLIDILASDENLQKARDFFEERINQAEDVWRILMYMHTPYRPLLFKLCANDLSDEDYAQMLVEVWTGTENPNQDANVKIPQWIRFFKKAKKELLMTEEELNVYNSLSDTEPIEIYRGVGHGREPYGLSWTANVATAQWFAKRWENKDAYMLKTHCNKSDVLAYFNCRGEDELVVNVKNLDKSKMERIDLNGG